MSGPEGRSIGDLLLECDLTARRLLVDPDALDVAAMLRVWPELVQAGHELLNALPGDEPEAIPGVSVRPAHVDPVGERLHLMASALNDNLRPRPWPGDGPADERLLALTGNLVRAHDLLVRGLRTSAPPSPAVQADAAAARTRVLHTLYVTAHGLSLAAGAEARALESNSRSMQIRSSVHKLCALKLVVARLDTFEEFGRSRGLPVLSGSAGRPAAGNHGTRPPSRSGSPVGSRDASSPGRRPNLRQHRRASTGPVRHHRAEPPPAARRGRCRPDRRVDLPHQVGPPAY